MVTRWGCGKNAGGLFAVRYPGNEPEQASSWGRSARWGVYYRVPRLGGACAGVPFDEDGGKYRNDHGQIDDGLYCVGWARRGPSGTIGTNRPDGYEVAGQIAAALPPGGSSERKGAAGLKALLASRGIMATDYDDWRRIEQSEAANARPGSPREKFVRVDHWLGALDR